MRPTILFMLTFLTYVVLVNEKIHSVAPESAARNRTGVDDPRSSGVRTSCAPWGATIATRRGRLALVDPSQTCRDRSPAIPRTW